MTEDLKQADMQVWVERIKLKKNTIWNDIKPIYQYEDVIKYEHFPTMRDLQQLGKGWEEFIQDLIANAFEEYFDFLGNNLKDSQKKTFVELTERYYDRFNILDLKYFITQCKNNLYKAPGDRFINCPMVLEWFTKYLNEKRNAEYEREEKRRKSEEWVDYMSKQMSDAEQQELAKAQESAMRAIDSLKLGSCSTEEEKVAKIKKKEAKIRLDVIRRNEDLIGDPDYETKINQLINDALAKAGITKTN